MHPSASTTQPKIDFIKRIVSVGLLSGIIITALIWLKAPNQLFIPILGLCLGLIGMVFLWQLRRQAAYPRWLTLLAAFASVSLVFLFPELFRPVCGGMPHAFAQVNCERKCIQYICEWNEKKFKDWCYCDEWETSGCTPIETPPSLESTLLCTQWGNNDWCIGAMSLKLVAKTLPGQEVLIHGKVNGNAFSCPIDEGTARCTIPLPEGPGTANVKAVTASGLKTTDSVSFKHDSVRPQIAGSLEGTNGVNDWFVSTVDVIASASDPNPASGIETFLYELTPLSGTGSEGWKDFANSLSLSDGAYSLGLRATDIAGNMVETNQTILIDTVTPTLDLGVTGNVGTNGWHTSNVQVSAATSDLGSGVNLFEYDLDSTGWAAYEMPLELTDGIHTLNLRVIDNAGNVTEGTQTFQIDTITPILDLNLTGTMGTGSWYTSNIQVSATAFDVDSPLSGASGLSTLEYDLDGAGWTTYTTPLDLTDGTHNLNFRAIDNAGNVTEGTQTFPVDTIAPGINLLQTGTMGVNDWYISLVQVEAIADDVSSPLFGASGLSTLESSVDGSEWSVYTTPLVFGDGYHTFSFRARDNAGNLFQTPMQGIQVDTIPPAVSLPKSWELGETARFELLDNGSGLASMRLVIGDDGERHPKVSWEDELESNRFNGQIEWDGRFKDGSLALPGGKYHATLMVSDNAGNESRHAGRVTVPIGNFMETVLHPSDGQGVGLVTGTATSELLAPSFPLPSKFTDSPDPQPLIIDPLSKLSFGGTNSNQGTTSTQALTSLGGVNNGLQPSDAQAGKIAFDTGVSSPQPASAQTDNILWGATATAAIGAFMAEIARRKKEQEEIEAILRDLAAEGNEERKQKEAAYQASLDYLDETLDNARALGMSETEVAKLKETVAKTGTIGASLDTAKDFVTSAVEEAKARERADRQTRKEEMLEPVIPPEPKQSSYVVPDMSWKRDDIRAAEQVQQVQEAAAQQAAYDLYRAQEVAAQTALGGGLSGPAYDMNHSDEKAQEKPFWDSIINWVDNHQKEVSIGIGVAVGIAAIALSGGAATPLVAAAWIAGSAAVAGGAVAAGTIGLNNHFGRPLSTNVLQNLVLAAGAAAATTTIGFVLNAIAPMATKAVTSFCGAHVTTCAVASPIFKAIDYGMNAYDVWQAERILNNPNSSPEERMVAGLTLGLTIWSEGLEPDELLPVSLPLDDIVRREIKDQFSDILKEKGSKEALEYLRSVLGNDAAVLKVFDAVNDYDAAAKLFTTLDGDVLGYALEQGPDAVKALSRWDENVLKEYGVELALRSGQDAKVLKATEELVASGSLDPTRLTARQEELIKVIAENSTQYTEGGQVVLGKWVDFGNGFSGAARETGSLHYNPHPDMWNMLGDLGKNNQDEVAWLINEQVIQTGASKSLPFEYTLKGLDSNNLELEEYAIEKIWEGGSSKEIIYANIKESLGTDYVPIRYKELVELYFADYVYSYDSIKNSYILIKP